LNNPRLHIVPEAGLELSLMWRLGGSVSYASAFGSDHDPRILGLSRSSGSLLSEESASPSLSVCSYHPQPTGALSSLSDSTLASKQAW